VEGHHGTQGKAGNDNKSQRFITYLSELTSELGELEGRPQEVKNYLQTEEPQLSDKFE
jgi:hypothetical protein